MIESRSFEKAYDPIFGDFENFDVVKPSPCRRIEITDQVRTMDAIQQASRVPAFTWRFKASLSIENLKADRRGAPKPRRVAEPRRFDVAIPKRQCLDCKADIGERRIKRCVDCAHVAAIQRNRTRRLNIRAEAPKRLCLGNCGRTIRRGKLQRQDNLCWRCAEKKK